MSSPLPPPDWLDDLFQQAQTALPDAGFSARVEQRVRQEKRRRFVLRHLPKFMGALALFVAGFFTGNSVMVFAHPLQSMAGAMLIRWQELAALGSGLAHFGLQPWMFLAGSAAAGVAFVFSAQSRPLIARF